MMYDVVVCTVPELYYGLMVFSFCFHFFAPAPQYSVHLKIEETIEVSTSISFENVLSF